MVFGVKVKVENSIGIDIVDFFRGQAGYPGSAFQPGDRPFDREAGNGGGDESN